MRCILPAVVAVALTGCDAPDSPPAIAPQAKEVKLTSKESRQLLKDTFIPEVNFVDLPLDEALREVERMLGEQLPPDQLCPKLSIFSPEDHEHHPLVEEGESRCPEVIELRVRNLPAEVLLMYVADATKTRFWLHEGDVYFGLWCVECMSKFRSEAVMKSVTLDASTPGELEQQINEAMEQVEEWHGLRPLFEIAKSDRVWAAIEKGEAIFPEVRGQWERITLDQLAWEIAKNYRGYTPDPGGLFFETEEDTAERMRRYAKPDSN